jgi:hypothetical protein
LTSTLSGFESFHARGEFMYRPFTRRSFLVSSAGAALAQSLPVGAMDKQSTENPEQWRVWEKVEITLTASHSFPNPYTDALVWVDLSGPGFNKRVYGFWDGDKTFRVRMTATAPGTWRWVSGSDPADSGLAGKHGSFVAKEWTETEKNENPLRRGFLRATANQHAIETADGTPFFALGDTWWAVGTHCFPWYDDEEERPIGPEAGFKDYVRYRKAQGFNWINVLASWPGWETDKYSWHLYANDADHTLLRSAWLEFGTQSAKNVENEGGLPFLFPGKVPGYEDVYPDVDRINPRYFHYLDRKIDYLNAHGFVAFIEASRRDASPAWAKYYKWPDSYARYIQYIFSRYHANNTVLSPIHLDWIHDTVRPEKFQEAIDLVLKKYGPPPFGTLLSANTTISTQVDWGENSWVTLQQTGNSREHEFYWYLTDIFRDKNPRPALNGEPYYAGYHDARETSGYKYGAQGGTARDDQFVRSAMYGNVLSGGYAGHVYGAEGIWGADIQPSAPVKMWDAFEWNSANQMKHLRTFIFSIGKRYRELVPDHDYLVPSQTYEVRAYEGWAYASRTPDKNIFLAYFEKGSPRSQVRGAQRAALYRAQWFNPQDGTWSPVGEGVLKSNMAGKIMLPDFPSDMDWGLSLIYQGKIPVANPDLPL